MSTNAQTNRPGRSSKGKKSLGFSLLECVIAVMVLSIGVMGVMSAMTYSVSQQKHAEMLPVAAYYAQQIMQDIDINNRHSANLIPPALPDAASGVNSSALLDIDADPFDTLFNAIRDTDGDGTIPPTDPDDAELNLDRFYVAQGGGRRIEMNRCSAISTNYRYLLVRVRVSVLWREAAGVDTINPGNGPMAMGGKTTAQRVYTLEAVLDND